MTFYLTDGSEDGFYSAVFDCYNDAGGIICTRTDVQLSLDCKVREVRTNGIHQTAC